jgi:maltose O-acetyltransferase
MTTELKTEKERMLAGEPYNSRDPELLARYHQARLLLKAFAETSSTETAKKQAVLAALLGGLGRDVWIEAPFFCDYGENIFIGSDVFVNYNCVFLDCNRIFVGDNVLIGPAVQIYTATHPLAAGERIQSDQHRGVDRAGYLTRALPVRIGNNVWIGGGAILMPGIEIGENTTLGAGSVVTKSVPANCFAAGNPCRVIRELQ